MATVDLRLQWEGPAPSRRLALTVADAGGEGGERRVSVSPSCPAELRASLEAQARRWHPNPRPPRVAPNPALRPHPRCAAGERAATDRGVCARRADRLLAH